MLVCIDRVDGSLEFFDHDKNNWHGLQLSLELSTKQLLCEVQWLQNDTLLFAFGGRNLSNNPLNLVWSFNLSDYSSQWTKKAPMKKNRSNFSSVVFDNNIYALGGNFTNYYSGNHILRSCESYDSQLNQWATIDSMKIARRNASAAIYNSCIYIAGGYNDCGVTERSVEKYDFQSETWSEIAPMKTARSHFALTPFDNRLWAIGGLGDNKQVLSFVESYDFKSNKWKKEESLNAGRIGHSAIEFNGELYVVGGFKKIIKNVISSFVSKPTKMTENYVSGQGWSENAMLQKIHPFAKLIIVYNINIQQFTTFNRNSKKNNNSNLNEFDQLKNDNDIFNETTNFQTDYQNDLKKFADLLQPPLKKVSKSSIASKQTFLSPEKKDLPSQQLPFVKLISLPKTAAHFVTKNAKQLLVCIEIHDGSVQFYDSQHHSWHSSCVLLPLPNKQKYFQLALLGSMLYAFGGIDADYNALNQMWSRDLSDPSSQWTAKADMKQSRKWFCSVVLNDTIYALGGMDNNDDYLRSCERYCSQLNEWSTVADMNRGRGVASAAVINGCIYVAGGGGGKGYLKSVCKYDLETDTWREVAPMTTERWDFSLTPFAGRLWAIGGRGDYYKTLSSCESYDPVTDTWREEAPMKEERCGHAAIEFNGELYVVGGGSSVDLTTVNKYSRTIGWVDNSELQKKCYFPQLFIIPPAYSSLFTPTAHFVTKNVKQLLVCIDIYDGSVHFYDPHYHKWPSSPISLEFPNKQYHFKLALLGSMLYAFGGWDDDRNALNEMWSRDLSDPSSQWTARADMKQRRTRFCSVVLNDTIYALGGENNNFGTLRSCERYCSQLNEWSTVADMNCYRSGASAAVINGCIYVAGGGYEKWSVEKYCPETDTWREVAPMTTGRRHFALTPFAGRLWAIGGLGGDRQLLSSCESYDPVTDTWREEAPMKERKYDHAAIEFNGELYVVGGNEGSSTVVEKYSPTIGWVENSQKKCEIPQLLIIPPAYSSYFTTNSN